MRDCPGRSTTTPISIMYYDKNKNMTAFNNFLSHLRTNHPTLLHADDIDWASYTRADHAPKKRGAVQLSIAQFGISCRKSGEEVELAKLFD